MICEVENGSFVQVLAGEHKNKIGEIVAQDKNIIFVETTYGDLIKIHQNIVTMID